MKKFLLFIAAAAVMTACTKEEVRESEELGSDSFKGVIETSSDSKTILDNLTVRWENKDTITINGVAYKMIAGAGTTTGSFEKINDGDPYPEARFKAFFANGKGGAYTGGGYALPDSYDYSAGRFNMPMYAEGNSKELQFKNICGVLKLSLTDSTEKSVSKIVIISDNQLNGQFTADSVGVMKFTSKPALSDADKTVTVNFKNQTSLSATASVFYLPVAPGAHKLTVKVYNGDLNFKSISMSSDWTFERNKLYTLSDSKLKAYTGGKPSNAR